MMMAAERTLQPIRTNDFGSSTACACFFSSSHGFLTQLSSAPISQESVLPEEKDCQILADGHVLTGYLLILQFDVQFEYILFN